MKNLSKRRPVNWKFTRSWGWPGMLNPPYSGKNQPHGRFQYLFVSVFYFVALQFTSILSPYLFCLFIIMLFVSHFHGCHHLCWETQVSHNHGFPVFLSRPQRECCTLRALWLVVGSDDVAHINSLMMWHMCSFHPWLQWWQVVLLTCQLNLSLLYVDLMFNY